MSGTPLGSPRVNIRARVGRRRSELTLDPQQPIVLGDPLGAARGTRLDLTRSGGHGQIRDERVLRLSGAVRDHDPETGRLGQADGIQRLDDRTDLVQLDQNRVGGALLDPAPQTILVRDEEVVTDDLDPVPPAGT